MYNTLAGMLEGALNYNIIFIHYNYIDVFNLHTYITLYTVHSSFTTFQNIIAVSCSWGHEQLL